MVSGDYSRGAAGVRSRRDTRGAVARSPRLHSAAMFSRTHTASDSPANARLNVPTLGSTGLMGPGHDTRGLATRGVSGAATRPLPPRLNKSADRAASTDATANTAGRSPTLRRGSLHPIGGPAFAKSRQLPALAAYCQRARGSCFLHVADPDISTAPNYRQPLRASSRDNQLDRCLGRVGTGTSLDYRQIGFRPTAAAVVWGGVALVIGFIGYACRRRRCGVKSRRQLLAELIASAIRFVFVLGGLVVRSPGSGGTLWAAALGGAGDVLARGFGVSRRSKTSRLFYAQPAPTNSPTDHIVVRQLEAGHRLTSRSPS